jgi:hypothetical protein
MMDPAAGALAWCHVGVAGADDAAKIMPRRGSNLVQFGPVSIFCGRCSEDRCAPPKTGRPG